MSHQAQEQQEPRIGRWRGTATVAGVVLGAYLLLLNPYWTPGGDSEMFISAARSIARGEGYTYNGKPVYVAPPAWSYLMAGAIWVSPTFLMLKAVSVALMAGAWVMAHRVMLRLAPPAWATWAAVLGALLVPVYSLTFWLHSEALFCFLSWGAALLAVRAAEDQRRRWEVFGVIVLCGLMASVRWTSGLQWGIVAAVLAGGWWRAREQEIAAGGQGGAPPHALGYVSARLGREMDHRITAGLGFSAMVTVLVFLLLFFVAPRLADALVLPAGSMQDIPPTTQDAEDAPPDLVDNTIFKNLSPFQERMARLAYSGHWPAWALWYPLRFAGGVSGLAWIPLAVGWVVIALLLLAGWRALFRTGLARYPLGRFVWPALVVYLVLLVTIWPLPNARYLVPVAPLLVLGVLWGSASLGELLRAPAIASVLQATFIASLLLANGAMFAIDARIQRSGDPTFGGNGQAYYASYEAGLHVSLLRAIDYLNDRGLGDHELAVSERYFNLNRMRFSKAGPRNVVMLTDRQVVSPPIFYSFEPGKIPDKLFVAGRVLPGGFDEWARRNGVKYYLYQQPSEPWRLWHFRISPRLQSRLTGEGPGEQTFGWLLFTYEDGFAEPVALLEYFTPPTRIPGL